MTNARVLAERVVDVATKAQRSGCSPEQVEAAARREVELYDPATLRDALALLEKDLGIRL